MKSHFALFPVTCFFWLLTGSYCVAQSVIHGKVFNSKNEPAANASVLLLQATDSSLTKAVVCDNSGSYAFSDIKNGSYLITTNFIGHKQAYSTPVVADKTHNDIAIASITLEEQPVQLNDVTVTIKKPLLEQKIDRLIINVAGSITAAGNTALEVLQRSPGVIVDRENNTIAINGKNDVGVMINGKMNYMPMNAIIQLLNGMSANNIERIELITTPPASFDAAGNAGYINIVLKQNNNTGTNGSFAATLGYGRGWITEASANVNHRKGRINIYSDISYSRIKKPTPISGYNKISNEGNITENYFQANRHDTTRNINGRVGLDWQAGQKTIAGILISGYDNLYQQGEHNVSSTSINGLPDTIVHHDNTEINHWYHYSSNINLQHSFNETDKVRLNADYIHYHNNQPVNYQSSFYDPDGKFVYDQVFRSGKKTPITFWVGSVDYFKKISNNISLETGVKQTAASFNNNISFERFLQNTWIKDDSLSADYALKENYSAAYATFNITINATTNAKAGLRYEHTNSNLGTEDKKNIIDRHYGNFFPSFFISHKINEKSNITVSYSRRITRPPLNDLAPFTYYITANRLLTGNPSLQPSLSDNFKTDYTFKQYLFSASWSVEHQAIARFQPHVDSVDNKIILSAENLIDKKTASVIVAIPFSITKWWSVQLSTTGVWQQNNALYKSEKLSVSETYINVNANMRFTMPADLSGELTGSYHGAELWGVTKVAPYGSLDIGIRKKLPQKWGSVIFNATNILNTIVWRLSTNFPEQNLVSHGSLQFSVPSFKLTYTRSFGNDRLKEKRERATGAEDEKRRVE